MITGLRRGKVAVEPHSAEWETEAMQTVLLLKRILRDTAEDVQHVGSTAVRSICAKPIIDIAVGVSDLNEILKQNHILAENGFVFRGSDIPGQYLYICGGADYRTHHIHVTVYQSEAWNNYINMRDYLNSHDDDAQIYAALKEKLAKQYPDDRAAYTAMKSGLIQEILRKANAWRSESANP